MIPKFVVGTLIGQYVRRYLNSVQATKAHLIESEIADRVVTRCGREMDNATPRGILFVTLDTDDRCKRCAP